MRKLHRPSTNAKSAHVAIIPPELEFFSLAKVPLDALKWPLTRPEAIEGKTVADLSENDHLISYAKSRIFFYPRFGVRAKVSVMFTEPAALHANKMRYATILQWRFHRFLTINKNLLKTVRIARRFNALGTWIPDWSTVDTTKTKMISLIASSKKYLLGHQMRHEAADWLRKNNPQADILGRAYLPFDQKSEGLAAYRYSVIIENVREEGYFTEKLIDSFLCRTIPIYWGAPDVEETFDSRGMIVCETFDEIVRAFSEISEADYLEKLPYLEKNRELAIKFSNPRLDAAKFILKDDN